MILVIHGEINAKNINISYRCMRNELQISQVSWESWSIYSNRVILGLMARRGLENNFKTSEVRI